MVTLFNFLFKFVSSYGFVLAYFLYTCINMLLFFFNINYVDGMEKMIKLFFNMVLAQ